MGDRQEKHFTKLRPVTAHRDGVGEVAFDHTEHRLSLPALAETNPSARSNAREPGAPPVVVTWKFGSSTGDTI